MKHRSFSLYPRGGTNAGGTGCAITNWNRHAIRLALLDVVVRNHFRKMFVVQSHERSPGSKRRS